MGNLNLCVHVARERYSQTNTPHAKSMSRVCFRNYAVTITSVYLGYMQIYHLSLDGSMAFTRGEDLTIFNMLEHIRVATT